MSATGLELIYIGDPMCSWCYGFSPVIQSLKSNFRDNFKMSLCMGGLHPGPDYVVDQEYRDFLTEHWKEVERRTGQVFSFGNLKELGWVYDTEKACRAVVVFRKLQPKADFAFFAEIQDGFYRHDKDPNEPLTFARAAEKFGVSPETFLKLYNDPISSRETWNEFAWARSLGVSGFPTVLVRYGTTYAVLNRGFQPMSQLEARLDEWLTRASLNTA
ncbi:DsbA family protein [Tropicibacter sp. Alg240-R139]|uniref:DsbA family protein n=1 Tax=Tropicibacter sp. Alg240-R139 TaxID=2305991 RepID=UPI0013DF7862|nr:DsbA family protein [Tropicibacter sp. Alg240-R139]